MSRGQPIRVRRAIRQHDRQSGYRWTCDLCPRSGGFHGFNRWTDHVLARRGKQAEHPWARAMAGANLHHHRYHAPRAAIAVTIHYATININGAPR